MTYASSSLRQPAIFIPHGGGPCFFMDTPAGLPQDMWKSMELFLRDLPASLPAKPRAILVISGHWMEEKATIHKGEHPELLYDYYGFPEHTYQLTWPAPGAPKVADQVYDALQHAGIAANFEYERGWDHGVFIPFKVAWPEADIPVVQLSLRQDNDPAYHLALGAALASLRDDNVLIIGSGLSFHNLRYFVSPEGVEHAIAFDAWLEQAMTATPNERTDHLLNWRAAPGARFSHPTPEHLTPLLVTAGAAGDAVGRRIYNAPLMGKPIAAYRFD